MKILQVSNFKKKSFTLTSVLFCLISVLVIFKYPKPFVAFGDILNKYSEAITALSAILGIAFGSSWLDISKKKMRGKLDYDIARRYLKGALKLRDAIKIVRNPFIPIAEMQKALEENGFNSDEYENNEKVNRSVYFSRWNKIQEAWTNFEEIFTEAEVSWGNDAIKIQSGLNELIRELRSVVWIFIHNQGAFDKKDKNEEILYGTNNENDEFAKKINMEIEKIRTFLKKYL